MMYFMKASMSVSDHKYTIYIYISTVITSILYIYIYQSVITNNYIYIYIYIYIYNKVSKQCLKNYITVRVRD